MVVGANSRLDELQAGLLRVKLTHMDEITKEREELANYYIAGIDNPKVIKPSVADNATCVWHQFVLRVPTEGAGENGKEASSERDRFRQYLEDNGIMTLIHYPIPPHMAQAYEYLNVPAGSLPITERFANEVISLPMYTGLTKDEQDRVIACVNSFK